MSVEAKICGLSTPETVDAAVAGGARLIGFNFYRPSPRFVGSNDNLKALGARVPKGVIRVGLFVDPDDALLDFMQSTYKAAANCGTWDRKALERAITSS